MIKSIIEKVQDNKFNGLDNVIKIIKMNLDDKLSVKVKWGNNKQNKSNIVVVGSFTEYGSNGNIQILLSPEKDDVLVTLSYTIKGNLTSEFVEAYLKEKKKSTLKKAMNTFVELFEDSVFELLDPAIHNQYKTYKEIEKAVKTGKKVYWANSNYVLNWEVSAKKIGVLSLFNNNFIYLGNTEYDIVRCFTKDGK